MKRTMHLITTLGLVMGMCGAAHADLITNGSFETTTHGAGQLGNGTDVTGWTAGTPSFAFVFTGGSPSAPIGNSGSFLILAGPPGVSPDGGNYIGSDANFSGHSGPISQVINGLSIGTSYTLNFDYAVAQQDGFSGSVESGWDVTFGGVLQSTASLTTPTQTASTWHSASMTFIANSASQTLSFLASNHGGEPPFALLDGVTLNASTTPEGSSLGLLSMGLLSMGGVGVFTRRKKAAQAAKDAA